MNTYIKRLGWFLKRRGWSFTCKTCGGHRLIVVRERRVFTGHRYELWKDWGPLTWNHSYIFTNHKSLRIPWYEQPIEITDELLWKYDIHGPVEEDPVYHEWYVRCAGCDREIPFGWSRHFHYRQFYSKIWPLECSDFDASKCILEDRYED